MSRPVVRSLCVHSVVKVVVSGIKGRKVFTDRTIPLVNLHKPAPAGLKPAGVMLFETLRTWRDEVANVTFGDDNSVSVTGLGGNRLPTDRVIGAVIGSLASEA